MIKDIVESRLKREYQSVINEIDCYMDYKYSQEIQDLAKKINILVSNEYFREEDNEKFFLEEEPICVKNRNGVDIVMPLSYFYLNNGNVAFVHLLLHALLDNKISGSDIFNEIIVDYMAEEISQKLKEKNINVTICDYLSYKSSSFYSLMFGEVEDFYKSNKNLIIDNYMGKEVEFRGVIEDVISSVELKAKNIMLNKNEKEQDNIQRR